MSIIDKIASISTADAIIKELNLVLWKIREFSVRDSKYAESISTAINDINAATNLFEGIKSELGKDQKLDNYTLEDLQKAYDDGYKIQRCRGGSWGMLRNRPTIKDARYKYRVCKGELVSRLNGSSHWVYTEVNYNEISKNK